MEMEMEMRDGDDYTTAIVLVLLLLAATGGAVALTFVKKTRAVCLEARAAAGGGRSGARPRLDLAGSAGLAGGGGQRRCRRAGSKKSEAVCGAVSEAMSVGLDGEGRRRMGGGGGGAAGAAGAGGA